MSPTLTARTLDPLTERKARAMTWRTWAWGVALLAGACTEADPVTGFRADDQGAPVLADASILVDAAVLESTMDEGRPRPAPDAGVTVDARVAVDGSDPDGPVAEPPACGEQACPHVGGLPQMCVEVPGSGGVQAFRCVPDPRGRAYLSRNFQLAGPVAELPELAVVEEVLSTALNLSGFTFALVFPPARDDEPFDPLDFPAHVVQGLQRLEDGTFAGRETVTTARRSRVVPDLPVSADPEGADALAIWVFFPHEDPIAPAGPDPAFDFVVPVVLSSGEPCLLRLGSFPTFVVVLLPPSADGGASRLVARMTLCLSAHAAEVMLGERRLQETLGAFADPLCDSNGDDLPDGWPITVGAQMTDIEFASDPVPFEGAPVQPVCN